MKLQLLCLVICSVCLTQSIASSADSNETEKYPTFVIVTLFRNKAHVLPYFFTYLEQLDYPKERITLWFRTDHNEDNTVQIIETWLQKVSNLYHNVNFKFQDVPKSRSTEKTATHWPAERHEHVIRLKEEGLNYARQAWADFVFFLDADVFLTEPQTLKVLIEKKLPIVSPMLLSDGLYSNFWAGMSDEFYYHRTDEYKEIYNHVKRGDFPVPMVHSAVLIDLRYVATDYLTFNRTILHEQLVLLNKPALTSEVPVDDIIIFSVSARYSDTQLYVSNTHAFGYIMVPMEDTEDFRKDIDQVANIKISILNDIDNGLALLPEMEKFVQLAPKDRMTLSKIFMINLERRPERRAKMNLSFDFLGLDVDYVSAVDGRELNYDELKKIGIEFLEGYADPYLNRPMTLGEIGCFLSHFRIWERIVAEKLEEVLILEDDIRFEPYFKERAVNILNEARSFGGWDLIYLGRKRLESQDEKWIQNSDFLVKAGYSYWTLGYIITLRGAQKLLDAKPLKRLLPVDEFLPIMFDRHQNATWKKAFEVRNLEAWSTAPLLLFPTYYTGEEGYISDTEDSVLINPIEDSNGTTVEKKGDKEFFNENVVDDKGSSVEEDEIVNLDPNDILLNTVKESLAEAVKTEL
ncbi:glycosyltransferase 25 family member isoform X1 [Bradysia coprophila]|uniref:glycosyltransferase 25 family member isoform X1 n=1 Tax=Bradysia coprophila TaxID=38358 RepID=UPI00187DBB62|nr:glycosyltransferase 25 family member isoform X1 [Bradysia coprophila]